MCRDGFAEGEGTLTWPYLHPFFGVVINEEEKGHLHRGKGEYECEVPLPFEFESLKLLRAYLRNEDLTAGPLFRTGKYKDQRMSYGTALYQWTKLCERAEVKCEIHRK